MHRSEKYCAARRPGLVQSLCWLLLTTLVCGAGCDSSSEPELDSAGPDFRLWTVGSAGEIWRGESAAGETSWSQLESPTEADLNAVWGSNDDVAWAVGEAGTILEYGGGGWAQVPSEIVESLNAIHGTSATDVWVVGDAGMILHWDGGSWEQVACSTTEDLLAVWAASPSTAWIGGPTGMLLEWDGSAWSELAVSAAPLVVNGFWGTSATDLWAIGGPRHECVDWYYDYQHDPPSYVFHRGPDGWSQTITARSIALSAVFGLSESDVWLASSAGQLFRWDGSSWFEEVGDTKPIRAIWGTSPDNLWSGGDELFLRRGATAWESETGPASIRGLWGAAPPEAGCDEACEDNQVEDGMVSYIIASDCLDVTCEEGVCDSSSGLPQCVCEAGFHDDGAACVADDACTGVACSGHGPCHVVAGAAQCDCDSGYLNHGPTACVPALQTCSADGWCLDELAGPDAGDLMDVWASGPDDIWAVGKDGAVIRRDELGWHRVGLETTADFKRISGTGPDDVWVAGHNFNSSPWGDGFLYHWDGQTWLDVDVDCTFGYYGSKLDRIDAVLAVAPDEVWISGARPVGITDHNGVCRWDGSRWRAVKRFDDEAHDWQGQCGVNLRCDPLWASSDSDIWCSLEYRGDATEMDPIDSPAGDSLSIVDVWGTGPGNVWAANGSTLFHWDGAMLAWETYSIAGDVALESVHGSASNDVWAVGPEGSQHWNGSGWTPVDFGLPDDRLPQAVWAVSSELAFVVGDEGLILRREGGLWAEEAEERLPVAGKTIWGAAGNDLWVGGENGLAHWDGGQWTAVPSGDVTWVDELLGFAGDDIWGHGHGTNVEDRLLRYQGAGWTATPATDLDFGVVVDERWITGISGTSSADLWVGGADFLAGDTNEVGFIAHWSGSQWSRVEAPGWPLAMWAGAGTGVWIAYSYYDSGTNSSPHVFAHWDGMVWEEYGTADGAIVRDLLGFATNDVWACGDNGAIWHWTGTAWDGVTSNTTSDLVDLWGTSPSQLWAAGGSTGGSSNGTILRWAGGSWTVESIPTERTVDTLFGVDGMMWAWTRGGPGGGSLMTKP